jgi:hypothetical protein
LRAARVLLALAAVSPLYTGPAADSAPAPSTEPPALFDRADTGTILDLYGARFRQTRNSNLTIVVRTHQPWKPADVLPSPTRMLCLWLRKDTAKVPDGRLCVAPDATAKTGLVLRYTTLDERGNRLGIRTLPTVVRRPQETMFSASFSPALLRLVPGVYHWQVRSIVGTVEDRMPDTTEATLNIAIAAQPEAHLRCFGAASRDARHPCVNSKLRTAIVPSPDDVALTQNSPCTPLSFEGVLGPCEFGVPPAGARSTIALIGDSHASHWRAALEFVAQMKGWRGVSMTRSGCPLMRATTRLEPPHRAECVQWNHQVPKWLNLHPKVHTVFVVSHFAGDVIPRKGKTEVQTKIAGFKAAWKALPKSVKNIIVIRDTPIVGYQTNDCVRKAKAKRRNAGSVCAVKRSVALRQDPAVTAAGQMHSKRIKIIDLSRFLCSAKRCFPVIGGALVYKDDQHMTDVFSSTLGPYLQRAIERVL